MHPRQQRRREQKRRRVQPEGPAAADAQHQGRGQRGACEISQLGAETAERLRALDVLVGGNRLRNQTAIGRTEERFGRTVEQANHNHLPDAHGAGRDEHGEDAVQHRPGQVRHDHHRLARQTVSHHPADENKDHQRGGVRSQNNRDIGGTVGQPSDEKSNRHDDQRVAKHTDRLAHPEQTEITRPQRRQHKPTVARPSPHLDPRQQSPG